MATPFPDMAKDAALILKAAILSVLITAPIFDILLNLVGSKCLSQYNPQVAFSLPFLKCNVKQIFIQDAPAIEKNFDKTYMNGDHVDETIYAARPKTYSEYRSEAVIERY